MSAYFAIGGGLSLIGLILLFTVARDQASAAGRAAGVVAAVFVLVGLAFTVLAMIAAY